MLLDVVLEVVGTWAHERGGWVRWVFWGLIVAVVAAALVVLVVLPE